MSVELLDNNSDSNGILDLTTTGGSDEQVTQETKEQLSEESTELLPEENIEGGESADTEGGSGEGDDTSSDDSDSDAGSEDELELYFGDQRVNVEVPDEIGSALKEAGIESEDIIKQLFKKDGDFSLDEDTRQKLEDKFGKTLVDGYLNMYKGLNEQALTKIKADNEAKTQLETKQGQEYSELVGGEEGLVNIENYVIDNFDEHQIQAYNSVMESGSHESQLLVLSQIKQVIAANKRATEGDGKVELVGDNTPSSSENSSPIDKGYLTYDEYQTIINQPTSEYWENRDYQRKVDNARLVGQKRGK